MEIMGQGLRDVDCLAGARKEKAIALLPSPLSLC
jgi:hypothetical protein